MSRSPRTVTQTSTTAPPAWLQQQQQDFLGRARGLSEQAYTPYTGQLVQGLTSDQTAARQMLRDRIASGGSQQFRDGRDTLNSIIAGGSYTAPGRVSVGSNSFLGATTAVGSNPYIGQTTEVARNRFLDENNPYLQGVIDNTLGDVTRAFNLQQAPAQLAQFAQSGAFGGSAHLQAMGESQRALAQELGRAATGLRSEDFNARRQLAESEADRITNTRLADTGRNADLAQRGVELSANISQADLARNAGLAQDMLGLRFNADTGNRDAEQRAREFAAGQQISALGLLPGFEDTGIRDIQALNSMGAEERDYLQQLLASQYGQFLDQRDWNSQRLGIFGDALGRVAPSYQNTTSTGANPNYQSTGQQIVGGGLALLGLGI